MLTTRVLFLSSFVFQLIGWSTFSGTCFEWVYVEEHGAEIQIPTFPDQVKNLDGKEIELSGFFLPLDMDGKTIVISKFPYSSCFFCGGDVGAETVAEIQFSQIPPRLSLDEIVHVKGTLQLNFGDPDHLTFILTDAIILDRQAP